MNTDQSLVVQDPNDNDTTNEKPAFGSRSYAAEELRHTRNQLEHKLTNSEISYRPGPGGAKVAYIETFKAIELANSVFGYNGWASSVTNLSLDYLDEVNGKISVGCSAVIKIELKDGTYHEDIGYGCADNQRNKGQAIEKAKKTAISDGIKRALRLFGNFLGNSIYDKDHLGQIRKGQVPNFVPKNAPKAAVLGQSNQQNNFQNMNGQTVSNNNVNNANNNMNGNSANNHQINNQINNGQQNNGNMQNNAQHTNYPNNNNNNNVGSNMNSGVNPQNGMM